MYRCCRSPRPNADSNHDYLPCFRGITMRTIILTVTLLFCSSLSALDYAQYYPQIIDVVGEHAFLDTNNAGIWYYYPPLNLWQPLAANVSSDTSSTNTLIHSHNVWSAYNMLQRNAMLAELKAINQGIQNISYPSDGTGIASDGASSQILLWLKIATLALCGIFACQIFKIITTAMHIKHPF